jgi:hypothetical protein
MQWACENVWIDLATDVVLVPSRAHQAKKNQALESGSAH